MRRDRQENDFYVLSSLNVANSFCHGCFAGRVSGAKKAVFVQLDGSCCPDALELASTLRVNATERTP